MQSHKHVLLLVVALTPLECAPPPDESADTEDADASGRVVANGDASESSATVVSPSASNAQPLSPSPSPSPSAAPDEDRPVAVEIGNPTDTGPAPRRPSGRVYVADGVPADSGNALTLALTGIRLEGTGDTVTRDFQVLHVNLLDFRDGARLMLHDGDLPAGDLSRIVLRQSVDEPVLFRDSGGVDHPVFLPPGPDGTPELVGTTSSLALADGSDLTVHVDLRYGLRPVDAAATTTYGVAIAGYDYWLVPEYAALATQGAGHLVLLGLGSTTAIVACAYPAASSPPLAGDDRCYDAAGSTSKRNARFFLAFLPSGSYKLRLYATPSLYVEVPSLLSVTGGLTTTLDLSALAPLFPLLP